MGAAFGASASAGCGLLLLGCDALLDLEVTYQDCVDTRRTPWVETFDEGDLGDLQDRCWRVDNVGSAASASAGRIFVEDGDLVIRVGDGDPAAADLDEWSAGDQAPLFFRRLEGDFLLVARVEAATKATGDHCLPPGNAAGLAVRRPGAGGDWATWTVEPHLWSDGSKQAECQDDLDPTNDPTATVRVRQSVGPEWAESSYEDVGEDGEVDLAICRVGADVHYLYRGVEISAGRYQWLPIAPGGVAHPFGVEPLDVGLTATGAAPNFETAGHFTWVAVVSGSWGDGCLGALEHFSPPAEAP